MAKWGLVWEQVCLVAFGFQHFAALCLLYEMHVLTFPLLMPSWCAFLLPPLLLLPRALRKPPHLPGAVARAWYVQLCYFDALSQQCPLGSQA